MIVGFSLFLFFFFFKQKTAYEMRISDWSSDVCSSDLSLLAVGLMNSIMFPTIFSLACEKLGARAADGSGIINVAIAGGAVIPALHGTLADHAALGVALALPALCSAVIAAYGVPARRPAAEAAAAVSSAATQSEKVLRGTLPAGYDRFFLTH